MADAGRPTDWGNNQHNDRARAAAQGRESESEVVRVRDTVRRGAGSWTPAVHDLLRYLAGHSYPAPRPRGIDDEGREILTFIPGECVHPDNLAVLKPDAAMRRVGKLIAEYHRAQAGYVSPLDAAWRSEGRDPTGSTEVIAHNDLAPWNLIAGPSGWVFIDWDRSYQTFTRQLRHRELRPHCEPCSSSNGRAHVDIDHPAGVAISGTGSSSTRRRGAARPTCWSARLPTRTGTCMCTRYCIVSASHWIEFETPLHDQKFAVAFRVEHEFRFDR